MEVLSRLLNKAEMAGAYRLHPLCATPRLTHCLLMLYYSSQMVLTSLLMASRV